MLVSPFLLVVPLIPPLKIESLAAGSNPALRRCVGGIPAARTG